MSRKQSFKPYKLPSGGWGSARSLGNILQFNTTVYGYNDRFRGIHGTRMVVLMNRNDIDRLGFKEGEVVSPRTCSKDNVERVMAAFRVTPYNIPVGCIGTYYPEANALLPIWHYAQGSKTPVAKSVPVRVDRQRRQ